MAYININVPYLKEIIKASKLDYKGFGNTIGQGDNWVHNAVYRAKARDYAIDMICRIYGADKAKLTTHVPNTPKTTEKAGDKAGDNEILIVIANGLIRVENKLDKLLNALGEGDK